jgi:hypothetical protein
MKFCYIISVNALAAAFLCLILAGCESNPRQVREFPSGYQGLAVVVWDVPGHPQLPVENGRLIERFPADGILVTSTDEAFGGAQDEEYFLDEAGHQIPAQPKGVFGYGGMMNESNRLMHFEVSFVGTNLDATTTPTRDTVAVAFRRLYPELEFTTNALPKFLIGP